MRTFLCTCLLLSWLHLSAQPEIYDRQILSIEEGLGDRLLHDIEQDTLGFYWVGTRSGVSRFDGSEFLNFVPEIPAGAASAPAAVKLKKTTGGYLTMYLPKTYGTTVVVQSVLSGESTSITSDALYGVPGRLINKTFDAEGRSVALSIQGDTMYITRLNYSRLQYETQVAFTSIGLTPYHEDYLPGVRIRETEDYYWIWRSNRDRSSDVFWIQKSTQQVYSHHCPVKPEPDFDVIQRMSGEVLVNLGDTTFIYDRERNALSPWEVGHTIGRYNFVEDKDGNLLVFPSDLIEVLGEKKLWLRTNGSWIDYSAVLSGVDQLFGIYSNNFNRSMVLATNRGLEFVSFRGKMIDRIYAQDNYNEYAVSARGMIRLDENRLFLGTDFRDFRLYDERTKELLLISEGLDISSEIDKGWFGRSLIQTRNGDVWGRSNGFVIFRISQGLTKLDTFHTIDDVSVPLLGPNDDVLLVGTNDLTFYDTTQHQEIEILDSSGRSPLDSLEGNCGVLDGTILWIGTDRGLLEFDLDSRNPATLHRFYPDNRRERINDVMLDSNGDVWIGMTANGFARFDTEKNAFEDHFTDEEGLSHNDVACILQDSAGLLWVSTYNGISCFDPVTHQFRNFGTSDGFSHDEFNRYSKYLDPKTGQLFFGGMNGFNAFHASELLEEARDDAHLRFTSLEYHDSETDSTYVREFFNGDYASITLPPEDRRVVVKFSLVGKPATPFESFYYRLGQEGVWQSLGDERVIRLDFLPVGKSTLEIKALQQSGVWSSPTVLDITVRQYWYLTTWAFVLYALLVIGIVRLLYTRYERRKREKEAAARLVELNKFKDDFFTNVTHEFRTPLTIILGSADMLQNEVGYTSDEGDEKAKRHVDRIVSSGNNLLRLINQILEQTKSKEAAWDLEFVNGDIARFVSGIVSSFESLAETKSIELVTSISHDELIADYDPKQLRLILHNLLSNAIKFTPDGGRVVLSLLLDEKNSSLVLSVADSGVGIAPEDHERVFEKYYRAENRTGESGTGIGLSLVKSLVEKMQGNLTLESELEKGSKFTLTIPFTSSAKRKDFAIDLTSVSAIPETDSEPASGYQLLIVEDNPDISQFFVESLGTEYEVQTAHNGDIGIRSAIDTVPDIILSDVMMPVKDGFELTETLKSNPATDHIPIVLLTAKDDVDDRIAGMEKGADAYLPKPFNVREVKAVVANLLDQRQRLQEHFKRLLSEQNGTENIASAPENPNEAFIKHLKAYVIERIENENITGEELGKSVAMSYWTFNKKLNQLTGMTPAVFIRTVRLEYSVRHLNDATLNISEVAYMSGFRDPKYFSRVFSKHFGKSPSEMRSEVVGES